MRYKVPGPYTPRRATPPVSANHYIVYLCIILYVFFLHFSGPVKSRVSRAHLVIPPLSFFLYLGNPEMEELLHLLHSLYRMPVVYLFLAYVFCYSCSFLFVVFCVFVFFFCSHWSLVDVPLIFFCPADHVPDWQPRIVLGMVEARSVNVKKTTTTTTRGRHSNQRVTFEDPESTS